MRDINLMPEEIRPEDTKSAAKPKNFNVSVKTVLIGTLAALVVILTILGPRIYIKILNAQVESINKELTPEKYIQIRLVNSQLTSASSALDTKKEVIDTIDGLSVPVNEIINSVKHIVPEKCLVTSINVANNSLDITVKFDQRIQVAEFLVGINRLGFLTLTNSIQGQNIVDKGEVSFSFNVTGKGGN